MKKDVSLILILSLLAVILIGCKQYGYGRQSQPTQPQIPAETTTSAATPTTTTPTETKAAQNTVEITSSGFNPNTLTINAGDTVTFVNQDSAPSRPASAVHPTHSVYPEPGGCVGSKFDACKNLAQGESWSFTFNQKGTWKYHDHLNPGTTGTIIVK